MRRFSVGRKDSKCRVDERAFGVPDKGSMKWLRANRWPEFTADFPSQSYEWWCRRRESRRKPEDDWGLPSPAMRAEFKTQPSRAEHAPVTGGRAERDPAGPSQPSVAHFRL
ncbi:hypothetical protein R1sor_012992 [Riccia sorocarpa]|uniref:Uncharacterized protein n=1 Tax=Riccia sorocarpa TaxID=122646 RepID=A0ABD3I5X3_9MARC